MTFDRPAINILGASVGVDHCAWKTPVTRWRQHRRHWAPTLFGARRPINSSTYLSPNIVNDNRQQRHYWCVIHLIFSPSFLPTNKERHPLHTRWNHQPIFSTCKITSWICPPKPRVEIRRWLLRPAVAEMFEIHYILCTHRDNFCTYSFLVCADWVLMWALPVNFFALTV